MAEILALGMPVEVYKRVVTCEVDLAHQQLSPSADRRNVIELWRRKAELDIERHMAAIETKESRR